MAKKVTTNKKAASSGTHYGTSELNEIGNPGQDDAWMPLNPMYRSAEEPVGFKLLKHVNVLGDLEGKMKWTVLEEFTSKQFALDYMLETAKFEGYVNVPMKIEVTYEWVPKLDEVAGEEES